ncbi:MAG: SH3 domain-containing protein [Muribaculaceae bacterium]|nr:SH3 domain-containing protein [Muribaculaceae bacterium]
MKRFLLLAVTATAISVGTNAQSMKMVVDARGNVEGRYVSTNNDTYTVMVQDTGTVPKRGHKVVTFSAAKGQGVIFRDQSRKGNINVRRSASVKAAIVAKIADTTAMGYVPECYPCLGKTSNGWYKIRIDGKVGYVRGDLVEWDGMCTF